MLYSNAQYYKNEVEQLKYKHAIESSIKKSCNIAMRRLQHECITRLQNMNAVED